MSWISKFRALMRRGKLSWELEEELEFFKLTGDEQTVLLLAFRERQAYRVIAQIARCSERAVSYRVPAALARLPVLLDRASML